VDDHHFGCEQKFLKELFKAHSLRYTTPNPQTAFEGRVNKASQTGWSCQ
jgi:hypothetical protein